MSKKDKKSLKKKKVQGDSKTTQALRMAALTGLAMVTGGAPVLAADSIPISVSENTTNNLIDVTSTGDDIKSGINVRGTAKEIRANFKDGRLNILNSDNYSASVIVSEVNSSIGTLNTTFDGTTITSQQDFSGALIRVMGDVTSITPNIKNNTFTSSGSLEGALVDIDQIGSVNSISSTAGNGFVGNSISVTGNASVVGGMINSHGTIGSISNTTFSGNTVTSANGNISGGTISNLGTITGDLTNLTFNGNTIASTNGNVQGAALYNTGFINGKIINSTFTNNTARTTSGQAQGGAIYTTTDLYISGNNGTTTFQNNKVIDSQGTRNQAIYVDSRIARITLDATNNGKIYVYDNIEGVEGYGLTLSGDSSGKIGLYGDINNANVTVTGGNIDFVNSKYSDFNFGQFTSSSNAKYAIDLNVESGKADNFTVSAGSSGTIVIDKLNRLGNWSDESKLIKILTASEADNVSLSLTQNAINNFASSETRRVTWNDEIPTALSWGDSIYKHERDDVIHRTISAVASEYGGKVNSLQYTVTTTQGVATSSILGDTLRLMNQSNGDRSFTANTSRNTHTVAENLGSTGTGTFNIVGVKDPSIGLITSTIDADGHSLFQLNNASTLKLSDLIITGAADTAGSVLNVTNSNAVVDLRNVQINNSGSNAIYNNGTINIYGNTYGADYSNRSLGTSITGNGTLNILNNGSGSLTYFYLESGMSITQKAVNIGGSSVLGAYSKTPIYAALTNNGSYWGIPDNFKQDVVNNGNMTLSTGTLSSNVTGTGTFTLGTNSTITANALVSNKITMSTGSTLNISADNVEGNITHYGQLANRSTINLSGGTLKHNITGSLGLTNITGDVIAEGSILSALNIAANSSLRIGASNVGPKTSSANIVNNGTIYLTDGTLTSIISGGNTYIDGDVTLGNTDGFSVNSSVIINTAKTLTATNVSKLTGGTIVNNGTFNINSGTLSRALSGTGTTNILGSVINNVALNNIINITSAGQLTTSASNIMGNLNNSGLLLFNGGTLSHSISGTGTTKFNSGSTVVSDYINQSMVVGTASVTFQKADYVGANVSPADGSSITLGSGILSHVISYSAAIAAGAEVTIANGGQITHWINLGSNSILHMHASGTTGIGSIFPSSGSHLYLTGGSLNKYIGSGGTIHIVGDVSHSGWFYSNFLVEENGELTRNMDNTFVGSITNNGIYNISGELNRNIAGTGTTKIKDKFTIVNGGAIAGTLNFNNGTLHTDNGYVDGTYSFGKLTGSGVYSFDADITTGISDALAVSGASTARITPELTLLNVNAPFSNTVFQVLKGASGAQLVLPTNSSTIPIINREEDFITSATVHSDDRYEIRDKQGVGTGSMSLASTDSTADSLSVTVNSIQWGDTKVTQKNIFDDWMLYDSKDAEKNFIFNSNKQSILFSEQNDLSRTVTGVSNIQGQVINDARSKIQFNKNYSFNIANGGTLNFSDVEIVFINNGTGFSNKSGGILNFNNVKISGTTEGIVNSGTIENMSGIFTGASSCMLSNGSIIKKIESATFADASHWSPFVKNTGTIESIEDSVFRNLRYNNSGNLGAYDLYNTGTIKNISRTEFINNYRINTGAGTGYGPTLNNTNKIENFVDNKFSGNYIGHNANVGTGDGRGAALYNTGTFTNGIIGSSNIVKNNDGTYTASSSFTGNYINTYGGYGGAIYNEGTINVIDKTLFDSNYIIYSPNVDRSGRGGAIYNAGNITDGITNSVFHNNYIEQKAETNVTNASNTVSGGAIHNSSTTYLTLTNTDFIGNYIKLTSAASGGSVQNAYGGAIYGRFNINGGVFDGNSLQGSGSYVRGGAAYLTNNSTVDGTVFRNNRDNGGSGGAVYTSDSIKIQNATFEQNYASSGGAIGTQGSLLTVTDSNFTGNWAGSGGAIYHYWTANNSVFKNSTFTDNHAGNGGAIYNGSSNAGGVWSIDLMSGLTFNKNYATSTGGGAIYNNNRSINTIENSSFTGNYVTSSGNGYGGAIYSDANLSATAGIKEIWNTVFRDNYVSGKGTVAGGAIYTNRNLTIGAKDGGLTEFSGNYVQNNGGAKT
ncbi:hypothetical protein HDR58_04630, partial [bacterium]|nr:hypothetical protein [bacterium]